MKHIKKLPLALVLVLLLSACKDETTSLLITSATSLKYGPDGGSQTFTIESNTDWHITTSEPWLNVTPSSGSNNQTVSVNVAVSDNLLEEEAKLIVQTADGQKVININVTVEGSYVKMGKYLEIKNHTTRMYMGGKAGSVDSLNIRSNINWEMRGPEWMEAWDGSRWRSLSPDRGVISGKGIKYVYLRTKSDNRTDDSTEGLITVAEQLTGNYAQTCYVEQLGRLATRPNYVAVLSTGVAFEWICGCDVDKVYFKVSKTDGTGVESADVVRQTYSVTDASYINSIDGLEERERYYIFTFCEDSQGNMGKTKNSYSGRTLEEVTQALAPITNAYLETTGQYQGQWKVTVIPNEYTTSFVEYASNNPNGAFAYNSSILYYLYLKNLSQESASLSGRGWHAWNLQGDTREIHAMTVARGLEGYSHKVVRYDKYFDANGNELPAKTLLDRIPKSLVQDVSLR